MKLSCITDQVNQDIHVACKILKEHNIKNIEIHAVNHRTIETCLESDILDIEHAINQYQMNVVALASTVFMMAQLYPEDTIEDFHPEFYKIHGNLTDHLDRLEYTLKLANRLKCSVVRIFPFRAPTNRVIIGDNHDQQHIIDNFKQAVALASKYNVVLVVENCPYSHLPKGNMTFDVVSTIDSPYLRLLYDPGNSYRANKDRIPTNYLNTTLMEELDLIMPYIHHVHIKDYHYVVDQVKPYKHKVIGKGDVPVESILTFLKKNNFQEAVSCEPELPYHETLDSLTSIVGMFNKI